MYKLIYNNRLLETLMQSLRQLWIQRRRCARLTPSERLPDDLLRDVGLPPRPTRFR